MINGKPAGSIVIFDPRLQGCSRTDCSCADLGICIQSRRIASYYGADPEEAAAMVWLPKKEPAIDVVSTVKP